MCIICELNDIITLLNSTGGIIVYDNVTNRRVKDMELEYKWTNIDDDTGCDDPHIYVQDIVGYTKVEEVNDIQLAPYIKSLPELVTYLSLILRTIELIDDEHKIEIKINSMSGDAITEAKKLLAELDKESDEVITINQKIKRFRRLIIDEKLRRYDNLPPDENVQKEIDELRSVCLKYID